MIFNESVLYEFPLGIYKGEKVDWPSMLAIFQITLLLGLNLISNRNSRLRYQFGSKK